MAIFLDALWAKPEMQCIPVVFLAAQAGLLEPHDYETLGVKGIIAKPFDPLTLHQAIAELAMAVACQFVSKLFLISVQLLESWKSFDPVCDLGTVKNGGFSKWIQSS